MSTLAKHQLKITIATFITVLIFIISITANFASWSTKMESEHQAFTTRQDHLSRGHAAIRQDLVALEKRQDTAELSMVEIKTKLNNIEALLIDIKYDLDDYEKELK